MAFNRSKTDPALGVRVDEHLKSLGLHTPTTEQDLLRPDEDKIKLITGYMTDIMKTIGLDLRDDSLVETPERIAKMWVRETMWGLHPENFPKCTTVDNKMNYNEVVVEKCAVKSLCEHHFAPFMSVHNPTELGAWIAYIPKNKVIGLSKLPRILEYFAARPQIQERLTAQVAETLKFILGTDDVAVVIKAQHTCVMLRGVEDTTGYTITSNLNGVFRSDAATRSELMALVNSK